MATQTQAGRALDRLHLTVNDLSMMLTVLLWGINFSVTKVTLAQIPPLAFAAIRFVFAAALLWGVLRVREGAQPIPRATLWKLLWIGVVGNTLYQIAFVWGLRLTTAANAALLISLTPALVALAGAALGIERFTRNIGIGVALAIAGTTLVLLARGLTLSSATLYGDLLMLGCAITWSVYTLGVRTLSGGLSPLRITTYTMVAGTPGLLLASIPDLLHTDWGAITPGAWAGLAYSGLFSIVVAYTLWNTSVRVVGSARTAIYACSVPLVAALTSWLWLGEQIVAAQLVGAALIIAGVLVTKR